MLFNSNDDKQNIGIFISALKKWLLDVDKNEKIYVIVQNPQQKEIISNVLNENKIFSDVVLVTTFAGVVYNTILKQRDFLSESINNVNLTGLDASQYVLKGVIKEVGFKDYKSQINILHQLFRRYSLIVQNDLTKKEVYERSQIAGEKYIEETQYAIDLYKKRTNELGSFDYLRQLDIFKYLIKKVNCFDEIKYLCVFNCEEFTPVFYMFLEKIVNNLRDYQIFYDKDGATRIGYLCAEKNCEKRLLEIFNLDKETVFKVEKKSRYSLIANALLKGKEFRHFENNQFLYRTQMIDEVKKEIDILLNQGVKSSDIAIITPINDETLKFNLKFERYYFLSGSVKLIEDFAIKNIIFLNDLLNNKIDLQENLFEYEKFVKRFLSSKDYLNEIKEKLVNIKILSQKIEFLYKELSLKYCFSILSEKNVKFLVKQIKDFEKIFSDKVLEVNFQEEILNQLKISVISENSSEVEKIPNDKIIVATEQKFIDYKIEKKYVFILDSTSMEWSKNDIGPMYNAWVMQKNYDKKDFTLEDNIEFSQDKLNKIFRKILLQCNEQIYLYSSFYDVLGQENYSGLVKFFKPQDVKKEKKISVFVPRNDQKEVLNYKSKKLAIAAVPGAGKTTILLELVKKMLNSNIKSENIFILTYMDSAAKNFKERLKNILPDGKNLPNVSTIHGLALRILKEHSNFTKINLDENFEIIDATKRCVLFSQAFFRNKCKEENYSDFERGISIMKFTHNPQMTNIADFTLRQFVQVFETYSSLLKENNLIDYDDMLVCALKLLKENPDILEYYQNICHYIIEDEAQDSSSIQQELLFLLSGKYQNLIRCGDLNQAITSTFTNADTQGFQNFIEKNKKIKMTSSQRCAKTIANFANKLNSVFKDSFYPIHITQTQQSFDTPNAIVYQKFNEETQEILNIANTIKNIQQIDKNAQIAILVRNNYQVEKYERILNDNGIKTLVKEGFLGQQKVFVAIFSMLSILNSSNNKDVLLKNYKKLCALGFYKEKQEIDERNQFWWDLKYFQNLEFLNFSNLIIKIGYFYFKNDVDKSNVEILSFIAKRICREKALFNELLQEFEKLSKKTMSAFFKFFESTQINKDSLQVKIMTIHKSKGDEFDYVFLPEFSSENFPVLPENYKIRIDDMFLENIKALDKKYLKKTRTQLQKFICDETLKLIYVAITRAKKQLFISYSEKIKKFNRVKQVTELTKIIELI